MVNEFLDKLMKNNLFNKDEFFSSNQNLKIDLLIKLYKEGKINNENNNEDYYKDIMVLINDIRNDLDGKIKKKKLDAFLNNDKSFIKERLGLLKIILPIDINEEYKKLKEKNDKINEDIKKLKYIKDNIIIYYPETYQTLIQHIIKIIQENQNKKIADFAKENNKD